MSVGNWWNDSDRRKPQNKKTYLSMCQIIHHKSHTDMNVGGTQASEVKGRLLTGRERAWPFSAGHRYSVPTPQENILIDVDKVLGIA